jgi:YD repeat-containing protein
MTRTFGPRKLSVSRFSKLFVATLSLLMCTALAAQIPTFVSFDAPDAGTGSEQGTTPLTVNQNGVIAGYYVDSAGATHGFVRLGNGQITEFDAVGLVGTSPSSISQSGQIVGTGRRVTRFNTSVHGFGRSPSGHFFAIDVPGAGATYPMSINDSGQVAGQYFDVTGVYHGFLRDVNGNYTTFDDPNGGTTSGEGTHAVAINANGTIAGDYNDSQNVYHGFVRDQFGNITSFDIPNQSHQFGGGVYVYSINLGGQVTGVYTDVDGFVHSFVRDALGNVTSFDMPGAFGTDAAAINDQGVIVGEATRGRLFGGFQRDASGNFTEVTVPVPNGGNRVTGITNQGRIIGLYVDSNNVLHGFVK